MERTQEKEERQYYGVDIGICDNIHVLMLPQSIISIIKNTSMTEKPSERAYFKSPYELKKHQNEIIKYVFMIDNSITAALFTNTVHKFGENEVIFQQLRADTIGLRSHSRFLGSAALFVISAATISVSTRLAVNRDRNRSVAIRFISGHTSGSLLHRSCRYT